MPLCGTPQTSPAHHDASILPVTPARYRTKKPSVDLGCTSSPGEGPLRCRTPKHGHSPVRAPLKAPFSLKSPGVRRLSPSRSPTHARRPLSKSPSPNTLTPPPRATLARASSACSTRMRSLRTPSSKPSSMPPQRVASAASFRSLSPSKTASLAVPSLVLRANSYSHSHPRTPRVPSVYDNVPSTARGRPDEEKDKITTAGTVKRSMSAGTQRVARDTYVSSLRNFHNYNRRGASPAPEKKRALTVNISAMGASGHSLSPPGTPPPVSPTRSPCFGEFVKETPSPQARDAADPVSGGSMRLEKGKVIKICARNVDDLTFSSNQLFQMTTSLPSRRGCLPNKGFNDKMSGGLVVAVVAVPKNVRTMNAVCTIASRVLGWTGKGCSSRVCSLHLPNGKIVSHPDDLVEGALYVANNLQHISSNPYEDSVTAKPVRAGSNGPTTAPPQTLCTAGHTTPGCVTFSVLPYGRGDAAQGAHPVSIQKSQLKGRPMGSVISVIEEELGITGCPQPNPDAKDALTNVKLMTLSGNILDSPMDIEHGGVYLVTSRGIEGVRQKQGGSATPRGPIATEGAAGGGATPRGCEKVGWALRTSVVKVGMNGGDDPPVTVSIPAGASKSSVLNIVSGALGVDTASDVGILNSSGENLLRGVYLDVGSGETLVATTSPGEHLIRAPAPVPGRKFSVIL